MGAARSLYERDFFEWTCVTAQLLRAGRLDQADIEHIAEEIEDMGKDKRRALVNRLQVLLKHLLKWKYQPARRGASWHHPIDVQRDKLADLLEDMPSLRNHLEASLGKVYARTVKDAAFETGLGHSAFPAECPLTLAQISDPQFFPE